MTQSQKADPKFVVVRLNETGYFSDEIQKQVKSIHAHYLFDENSHTYCCELTPSYDLRWVGFDIEEKDSCEKISQDLHETVADAYHREINDMYWHCRDIDKIEKENKKVFMQGSDLDPWSKGYGDENILNEVIAAYQADPLF